MNLKSYESSILRIFNLINLMDNLEQIKKFIELRSSGHTIREIAKILNKSVNTILKWNKQYCSVVFEVQSEELSEFKKKLLEEKKSRLDFLNMNFTKLKEKLDRSEIIMRYDKMLFLLMKLSRSIDECQRNIVLSEISENLPDIDENDIINEINKEENVEKQEENEEVRQN
jgi:hypothetical protein